MTNDFKNNPIIWSPSEKRLKSSQMYLFMENINKNLDLSTKLGRDIFEFSKEMTQKIVLHERTIEE